MKQYFIPQNFAQEGMIYGKVKLRNAIEAFVVLVAAILFVKYVPLDLKPTIYITILVFLPIFIFCIIGINGFSLVEFIALFFKFKQSRAILKKPSAKDKIMREKMLIEKRQKQKKAIEKERKKEERQKKLNKYNGMFSKKYKEEKEEE